MWTNSGPVYESSNDATTERMTPLNKLALRLRIAGKSWSDILNSAEVKRLIEKEHPEYKGFGHREKMKFWANVRGCVNKVLRK